MPTYRVTGPDGKVYQVTPPPGTNPTKEQILEQVKAQANAASPAPSKPDTRAADANARKEMAEGGFPYALGDSARQFAKGAIVAGGLLDEGIAGASSLLGGDYDKTLEYERARDRARHEANPESAAGMNLFGGAASALLGAPALRLGGLGVNSAKPIARRALAGGAVGAPLGAADAFTRGEGGLENRANNAFVGGGVGLLTGVATPLVGQAISSGYQEAVNAISRNASLRGLGMGRPVAEELIESAQADDVLGHALARIRAGGPDAMLADAGPNMAGTVDAVIQKGGPGATHAARAVEERASQASRNLTGTLDRTLGQPVGVTARRTNIREAAQPATGQIYDIAYATPINYASAEGRQLARLWEQVRPVRREQANALLIEGGYPPIREGQLPDARQIDYVTRALNDVVDSAEGTGATGGINATGHSAQRLSISLREALRAASPTYAAALDTAADTIGRSQAVKLGSQMLSDRLTRSDLAERLRGFSGPEREAVRSGLRDYLDDVAARVKQVASDPNADARELRDTLKALTSRSSREKVGMILENPNQTMAFFREIGQSMRALEMRANIAANARTATRQERIRGMDERMKPGAVGTALEGDIPGAGKKAIAAATGATQRQARLRSNEQWLQMSRALVNARGRQAEDLMRRLIAAGQARAQTSARGGQLGRIGAGTVAGSNATIRGQIPF